MSHAVVVRLHRPLVLRALDVVSEIWRRGAKRSQGPVRVDAADTRLLRDIGLGEFAAPPQPVQREGGGWASGGWKA